MSAGAQVRLVQDMLGQQPVLARATPCRGPAARKSRSTGVGNALQVAHVFPVDELEFVWGGDGHFRPVDRVGSWGTP